MRELAFVTQNYPVDDKERVGVFNKLRVEEYRKQGVKVELFIIHPKYNTVFDVIDYVLTHPKAKVYINKLYPDSVAQDYDVNTLLHLLQSYSIVPVVCVMGQEFDRASVGLSFYEKIYRDISLKRWFNIFKSVPCRFIAISEYIWEVFYKDFKPLKKDSVIIPIGIQGEFLKTRNKPSEDKSRVLIIKRLDNTKSCLKLIKGIIESVEGFSFTIVGRPPKRKDHFIRFLERSERVKWLSEDLSREDLIKLVCLHDIFLNPSKHEAQGILNLECGCVGLPIVCSDVGAVSEFVKDGVNGRVLDGSCGVMDYVEALVELRNPEFYDLVSEHNKGFYGIFRLVDSCRRELEYIFDGGRGMMNEFEARKGVLEGDE